MAQASSILNADRSRAIGAALGLLCLLAGGQVVMVSHTLWKKADGEDAGALAKENPASAAPAPVLPTISYKPPAVGELAAPAPFAAPMAVPVPVPSGMSPPEIGSFAPPSMASPGPSLTTPTVPQAVGTLPGPPSPALIAPAPTQVPPEVSEISPPSLTPAPAAAPNSTTLDMPLQEMVDLAKQVRALGDMQGALEVLKRADLQYPGSPEVLAETAQCYETMGLADKAAGLWRQLENMDPARASGYRDLAQRRLGATPQPDPSGGFLMSGGGDAGKILSLGACQAMPDATVVNGEKVVLRIPILRQGNTPVDPAQVDIDVYFFDRVNGEKIAQTIADEPVSSWVAAPVDWSGIGEEPLDVTYFLPPLTPGEIAAHGRRSYHGYVVRLYYQNKLQDVAAEPRDLLDFGSRTPQTVPGGMNPLLPPVSQ